MEGGSSSAARHKEVKGRATDLQSTESRLQSDFRTVQTERAKLQQLIDNLNNVNAEGEKTRAEERDRLEKRIEELQKET
jgi:nucleoprotein TPR